MTGDCCAFKFLLRLYSVDEKHLTRFQIEASVFKSAQGLSHYIKNGFLDTNYSQSDRCKIYVYE